MEIDRPNINNNINREASNTPLKQGKPRWKVKLRPIEVRPDREIAHICGTETPSGELTQSLRTLREIGRVVMERGGLESPAAPEDW